VGEVLPLEAMLMRFLVRNWKNTSEIADLRQEVYARVYESAGRGLLDQVKPFVFMIARNLMIDHLRRGQIVSIDTIADLEALNIAADDADPERLTSARQELKMLQTALDNVPARQREVIVLRKVEGLSQREGAARIRFLADALADTSIATGRFGAAARGRKKVDEI
jgi:RNA polymerase sigma-70 factor (ECF subfamily)